MSRQVSSQRSPAKSRPAAAIGKTGLGLLDAHSTTLVFLSEVGFAMLMFSAGMSVPLSDRRLRESLSTGAIAAALVGALAIPAAVLITLIPGVDHPAIYAVLIASGSAAVVVPIIDERRLEGEGVLALIAQVTVADIAATVAIPFVLRPDRALHTVIGTVATAGCVFAVFIVSRLLRARPSVQALRKQGKRRHWAIDLRVALIALFALAWVAERTGTSILIAGFGAGLMVAAIGGPKRLSHEVLGIAGGFFIPLFFVTLGARLQLRGVVEHPAILLLTILLVAFTVVVHATRESSDRTPARQRPARQRPARSPQRAGRAGSLRARAHRHSGSSDRDSRNRHRAHQRRRSGAARPPNGHCGSTI